MCCAYVGYVPKVHCAVIRMVRTTGALMLFRYLLRLRRRKRKSVEVGVIRSGRITLRLNFRLNGYFSRQYLWTVIDGECSTLLLKVFTQRNFVADFIWLKLTIIPKTEKNAFWATFLDLRVIYALSIARWKARGRLYIRHLSLSRLLTSWHNWTFSLSLTVETL